MGDPQAWRKLARCLGMGPDAFVPSRPGGSLKRVLKVCNGDEERDIGPCPVRTECGQYAKDNDLVGVFGGENHSQRAVKVTVVTVDIQDGRPTTSLG